MANTVTIPSKVTAPLTTPPPPPAAPSGLPAPMTDDQIRAAAQASVQSDIDAQTAPLEGQIGTLQGQETRVVGDVGNMFDTLQPQVQQGATAVQTSYDNAQNVQRQIFDAANQRMNALAQSRAQEAQRLAQEMGGPVAVSEFTAGMNDNQQALTNLGAGAQLHTLAYAQAGEQQANAFAGQVFPLIRTEETAKARNYFEDQIKDLRKQITSVKSQSGSLVNKQYLDMRSQELNYRLQQAQFGLDKVKANRDWQASLKSLKNDTDRVNLAKKQFGIDTKKTNADITATKASTKLATAAEKRQAAALDLSVQEFKQSQAKLAADQKLANRKLAADNKVTWAEYLDAAVNPQPGKTVTTTVAIPVSATAAITGKIKDAYKDPSSPTGYSHLVKQVNSVMTDPVTNPSQLVDWLMAHQVPRTVAIQMTRQRLGLDRDWVPGQGVGPAAPRAKRLPH